MQNDADDKADPRTIFRQCERFLGGGSLKPPEEVLSRVAQEAAVNRQLLPVVHALQQQSNAEIHMGR